jgi:ribonuclease HI
LGKELDKLFIEPTAALAPQTRLFFTDGSGFEGSIGASAVAPQEATLERRHLGSSDQSTVYLAELTGIEMAIASFKANPAQELVIFVDSQAAIQAVQSPKRPSAEHILCAIYDHVRAIAPTSPSLLRSDSSESPPSITIWWVPAHGGVHGNELADIAAKEAAQGSVSAEAGSENGCSGELRLATNARRAVRDRVRAKWALEWSKEKTGKQNQRLTEAPDKNNLKLFNGLSKPYTSILVQMRSMRIGLRHFLYKINEAESDRCGCEEGSQTPRHVLLQCPLYTDLRKTLMQKIRSRTDPGGNSMDYEASILSHPQATRYVAEFMLQTGLLGQFCHCDVELEPAEDETEH